MSVSADALLQQQLLAYAAELRTLRRRHHATEMQASRYAGELRELFRARVTSERDRRARESLIRRILLADLLVVVFQPIVALDTGALRGYEALARIISEPPRPPDVWFHEAAEVGLDEQLEVRAIEHALAEVERIPSDAYLSINASPDTLVSDAMPACLDGAPLERIVFEVTEHAPVEDYRVLADRMRLFRARGARLAVDDAGAGYASLRHTLLLEPDLIKLDISLTKGIDGDERKQALAGALIDFAGRIGAAVLAEGIETEEEREVMLGLGATFGQGYLFGRPAPLPEV